MITCASCEIYDTEVEIRGPAQLGRIVGKIQDALRVGRLCTDDEAPSAIPVVL